jgi:hypothetical protein
MIHKLGTHRRFRVTVLGSVVAEKSTILDNAARMYNRISKMTRLKIVIAENHPPTQTPSYPRRAQSSMKIFTFH